MIANRYCQITWDQDDICQIDAEGRFFSNQYAAVAEQYLRTPVNDNKLFKSIKGDKFNPKIFIGIIAVAAIIAGIIIIGQ